MKLTAYLQSGEAPHIRPASHERAWMDRSPQQFAYRCLPLNIANAHGWEAVCPGRVRAIWFGTPDLPSLTVETDLPSHQRPISHFGSGILTFHIGCLLRTDPGVELWVSGPPNRPKHGIYPLTGVVETDWAPFSFTMNWQFTRPGEIIFEKDEPFCFFFPIARDVLAKSEPEFRLLSENPELEAEFAAWTKARSSFNADLTSEGSKAREQGWQRDYFKGKHSQAHEEHLIIARASVYGRSNRCKAEGHSFDAPRAVFAVPPPREGRLDCAITLNRLSARLGHI